MINDAIKSKITQIRNVIFNGNEKTEVYEHLGEYVENGDLCLGVLTETQALEWKKSLFPEEYIAIYELKCDEAQMAGGMFSGGPKFEGFDPNDDDWDIYGFKETIDNAFFMQRDMFGSPFFFRTSDKSVYCINCEVEFQRIGSFTNFLEYCLDELIAGRNWYTSLKDKDIMKKYALNPANALD